MSFRRCLSGGGDIFSKSVERQADVAMDVNWSRARTD